MSNNQAIGILATKVKQETTSLLIMGTREYTIAVINADMDLNTTNNPVDIYHAFYEGTTVFDYEVAVSTAKKMVTAHGTEYGVHNCDAYHDKDMSFDDIAASAHDILEARAFFC